MVRPLSETRSGEQAGSCQPKRTFTVQRGGGKELMTLRRGLLLGCSAATLFAQEFHFEAPVIDKFEIDIAIEKAMAAKHEVLFHKEELLAAVQSEKLFAKEAMAMDKAMAAMKGQLFFYQGAK